MPGPFEALTHWQVYAVSTMGGAVSFIQHFVRSDTWKTHIRKLAGRVVISNFAGMMGYAICAAMGVPPAWILVAVGILSWRGAQGLKMIGELMDRRINGAKGAPRRRGP